ncbi:MAG: DUF1801 domain-containing protein [Acidobacteria bacterium]|nr:DUF1801 domain-containing protein [Acidobacteriota bacterium]
MNSKAATVAEYMNDLPEERRKAIDQVRKVIKKNLPKGVVEGMNYGAIGYYVPHKIYPPGYHCDPKQPLPFAGLASQKGHMSIYLCTLYMNPELEKWLRGQFAEKGKKLDMGKGCVRFKKLEDLPLDVVGAAVARMPLEDLIALYDQRVAESKERRKAKTAAKKK